MAANQSRPSEFVVLNLITKMSQGSPYSLGILVLQGQERIDDEFLMIGVEFPGKIQKHFFLRPFSVVIVPCGGEEIESAWKLQQHQFVVPHYSPEGWVLICLFEYRAHRPEAEIRVG